MSDPAHERPPAPGTRATGPDNDGSGTEPAQPQISADSDGLLAVAANLSRYHREHEKYYAEAPLADAIALQRTARTLIALAERWASAEPAAEPAPSPFAGTPDLNDDSDRDQRRAVHGRRGRARGDQPDQVRARNTCR